MFRKVSLTTAVGLLACLPVARAQTPLHGKILQIYSFQSHTLTKSERAEKSAVLDAFWSESKAHKDLVIPELRKELTDFTNPPFFLYDGSMLLLSLGDTHENRVVALAAIAHCDLRDIQPQEYFLQVHRLASEGEDATVAAFHVLDDPNFQVFIPEHVLTLNQNYVLVYLLLPMEEKVWVQPAVQRLSRERDETAQKSLLLAIWYAQTADSNQAIARYAADDSKPEKSREYAQELQKRTGGPLAEVKGAVTSEETIRKKRRERMRAVSDEALYDLDDYTRELIAKRN